MQPSGLDTDMVSSDADGGDRADDLIGVLERSKSYDAYQALIKIIDQHPKALDSDMTLRAGRALLSHGWDQRLEHLLTRRVRGGRHLLGAAELHQVVEQLLGDLEGVRSRLWDYGWVPRSWRTLHALLAKRPDALDDLQLDRVIHLQGIEYTDRDERDLNEAVYRLAPPESLGQLAKAELRRRRGAAPDS